MIWHEAIENTKIELTREETLGLIHVLNSIIEQAQDEIEEPSLEHPCHNTEAPIKPLLTKLLMSAVNAEYIRAPYCIRPRL